MSVNLKQMFLQLGYKTKLLGFQTWVYPWYYVNTDRIAQRSKKVVGTNPGRVTKLVHQFTFIPASVSKESYSQSNLRFECIFGAI